MHSVLLVLSLILAGALSGATAENSVISENYDRPIDPETYLIRPGEILNVTFINSKIDQLTLTIDAEGRIVDESVGTIDLSGKTLAQAREFLVKRLNEVYKAERMVISVGSVRQVSISVTGAVAKPGIYSGFTSWPVSRIIELAGGVTNSGSRRKILLKGGPKDLTVDLERAIIGGEEGYNPPLYAGKSVFVPYQNQLPVQLVGAVNAPKAIELLAGDDIPFLISLAGGFTLDADSEAVRVIPFNGNNGAQLSPGDIIFVPALSPGAKTATVSVIGAVQNSGYYSYQPNMTLASLLEKAGGFLPEASKEQTTVFRKAGSGQWEKAIDLVYPISNVINSSGDGMTDLGSSFILSLDDSVFVPTLTGFVNVQGVVANPGLYPFTKGKSAKFYIDLAGGFLTRANKEEIFRQSRISRARSAGTVEIRIYDGDVIIVEVREELR